MENEEIWKDVVGYEGFYQVSNLGNVRSVDRIGGNNHKYFGKILKQHPNKKGYPMVSLKKNCNSKLCTVHRLVAKAFIPNPNNFPMINHKDEVRTNNHVDNLEWCDATYNNNYGLRGKKVAKKLGKPVTAIRISDEKREWYRSLSEMARELDTTEGNVWRALNKGTTVCGRKVKEFDSEMTDEEFIQGLHKLKKLNKEYAAIVVQAEKYNTLQKFILNWIAEHLNITCPAECIGSDVSEISEVMNDYCADNCDDAKPIDCWKRFFMKKIGEQNEL